jgi:hypothetical protein
MASYAVTAHIDRVQPHLASHDGPPPAPDRHVTDEPLSEAIEVAPPPSERWDRFRERWAQTTFYLFDPESWR